MKYSEILYIVQYQVFTSHLCPLSTKQALFNLLLRVAVTKNPEEFAVWSTGIDRLYKWVDTLLEGNDTLLQYLSAKGIDPKALAAAQNLSVELYMYKLELKWLDWMVFTCKEENN